MGQADAEPLVLATTSELPEAHGVVGAPGGQCVCVRERGARYEGTFDNLDRLPNHQVKIMPRWTIAYLSVDDDPKFA